MKKWVYKVALIKQKEDEATLNKLGEEGWELTNVVPSLNIDYVKAYLKKEAQD